MQTGLAPRRIAVVAGTAALVAAGLLLPSSAGAASVVPQRTEPLYYANATSIKMAWRATYRGCGDPKKFVVTTRPGYLGSIGFGYPAAMGAWAAAPDRPTVAVIGDGGFGQYMGEITTAVKYGMDITHVLLNNSELGKISKEQRAGEWDVWETDLHNPDFAAYAELCGAQGIRVTQARELDDALVEALDHDGPSLVEVVADPELI